VKLAMAEKYEIAGPRGYSKSNAARFRTTRCAIANSGRLASPLVRRTAYEDRTFSVQRNYYRSRYAEFYFNWLAPQHSLNWRAESRGFRLSPKKRGANFSPRGRCVARSRIQLPAAHRLRPWSKSATSRGSTW